MGNTTYITIKSDEGKELFDYSAGRSAKFSTNSFEDFVMGLAANYGWFDKKLTVELSDDYSEHTENISFPKENFTLTKMEDLCTGEVYEIYLPNAEIGYDTDKFISGLTFDDNIPPYCYLADMEFQTIFIISGHESVDTANRTEFKVHGVSGSHCFGRYYHAEIPEGTTVVVGDEVVVGDGKVTKVIPIITQMESERDKLIEHIKHSQRRLKYLETEIWKLQITNPTVLKLMDEYNVITPLKRLKDIPKDAKVVVTTENYYSTCKNLTDFTGDADYVASISFDTRRDECYIETPKEYLED